MEPGTIDIESLIRDQQSDFQSQTTRTQLFDLQANLNTNGPQKTPGEIKRGTEFMKQTSDDFTNHQQISVKRPKHMQMQSKVIDMTHDTLPEIEWRPIKKIPETIPPPDIISDVQKLAHWEYSNNKEHFKFSYDRAYVDNLVLK